MIRKFNCREYGSEECSDGILHAAEEIADGKLVVYPTETVYGIGADIYNPVAVKNLFIAKKRPFDMALSVAVSDKNMMEKIAVLNENADKLIDAFLPGPLTIIIEKQPDVSDMVTSGSKKVGVRIPDNKVAIDLIKRTGPIVATSANTHSKPDSLSIQESIDDFGESVSLYLDAGDSPLGHPSTIIWLNKDEVEIIRPGGIAVEEIEAILKC